MPLPPVGWRRAWRWECWSSSGLCASPSTVCHRGYERSPVVRCCLGRQCEQCRVLWLGFVPHSQQQRSLPPVPDHGCTRADASWVACGSRWRSEGTLKPWDSGAAPHLWVTFLTPWEGLCTQSGALHPVLGVKGAAGSGSACQPSTHGFSPGASLVCLGIAVGRQVCSPCFRLHLLLGWGVRSCGCV